MGRSSRGRGERGLRRGERSDVWSRLPLLDWPTAGTRDAFARVEAAAAALAASELLEVPDDLAGACRRALRGLGAVLVHDDAATLPSERLAELGELEDRVGALAWVVHRDHGPNESELLARARRLSKMMRASARALAEAGVLHRSDLPDKRARSKPRRVAKECAALAALFLANASAVAGKTPLAMRQILEAAQVGAELERALRSLRPERERDAELLARLWTLVARRHEQVWRTGAFLFGRQVDLHVPPLLALSPVDAAPGSPSPRQAAQGVRVLAAPPELGHIAVH